MEKIELFKTVSRYLNDFVVSGVPTNSTATYIEAPDLVHPITNQLRGYNLFFYEGAGASMSRVISAFTPSSNRASTEHPFSTIPSINSKFIITERFDSDDYESAFQSSYNRFYQTRTNLLSEWKQWENGITQRQLQWKNEKQAEIDAWVVDRTGERDEWHGQQLGWQNSMEEGWKYYHASLYKGEAFRVPSLNINAVGTIAVGTVPIGSLSIPSLSLATAATISTFGSYGSTVPDDLILEASFKQILVSQTLPDKPEWKSKYDATTENYNNALGLERAMLDNLKDTTSKMWEQHKQQFDITWVSHKDRYEQSFTRLQESYDRHKAGVELRWTQIVGMR